MKVEQTAAIRRLLVQVRDDPQLPQKVRNLAADFVDQKTIEWKALKEVVKEVHRNRRCNEPTLHELCKGGGFALEAPRRRPSGKSSELEAHLARLRAQVEQQRYDSMVSDVTKSERAAALEAQRGVVAYKQQLSFGFHVVIMMGAFYAFGHVAGTALSRDKVYHLVIGLGSMVLALLLETILFIIRSTVPVSVQDREPAFRKLPSSAEKKVA